MYDVLIDKLDDLVMFTQAIGGAVAVVAGVYMTNSVGQALTGVSVFVGRISVENSVVAINQSRFTNCVAESLTDSSIGTTSVFGGASAILQLAQVSSFRAGLFVPSDSQHLANGINLSVLLSKSYFLNCSVFCNASSVQPGKANGAGGAVYAHSVAFTNFIMTNCTFISNRVSVLSGATGLPSFSSGGALAVEAGAPNLSSLVIASSVFFICEVQGASIANMGVRGGALHVSHFAQISVIQTNFTNCSIIDAVSSAVVGNTVSGGAAMSALLAGNVSINGCIFDATGGRDMSETSTGLLLLSRSASKYFASVSHSLFMSSTVVLGVQCVGDDGARSISSCVGLHIILKDSKIFQVLSQTVISFNGSATGSALLSLQNPQSISFAQSRMYCALSRFAAFKEQPAESSTRSTLYSCKPCLPFQISLTANVVSLEDLHNARNVDRCFPASNRPGSSGCPFGVTDCTTFVSVSSGFWTTLSTSGTLNEARRCPLGYCGCDNVTNGACPLPPPMSIDRDLDPLCKGKRTGTLCGGCPAGFTQSLDDESCIENELCSQNLWWVWTVSILGFVLYSLYIVLSCGNFVDSSVTCVLFYLQISSYASDSEEFGILQISQFESLVAFLSEACYAPNMSAYNATASKLIGPFFVLILSAAWTWILRALQPWLQKRNIRIEVSYSGTHAVTILYVFSSVADVVFNLVECTSYDNSGVVFIDGTVPCLDNNWKGLMGIVVLMCLFPVVFFVFLWQDKLPENARDVVCGNFTERMFYWEAVTLEFRLLVSVAQLLQFRYPNLLAFVRMILSMCVFILLLLLRPHISGYTFWVDVACYTCLIAQFGLRMYFADVDYFAVTYTEEQKSFSAAMRILIWMFRFAH